MKEFDEAMKSDLAFYRTITEERKKSAAKEILSRNPIRAISLTKLPLSHPGWRAMILRMLRDGIYDTEEEDVNV